MGDELLRQIGCKGPCQSADKGDMRRAPRQQLMSEPRNGTRGIMDELETIAVALRRGGKDAGRELRIIARQSMARPVGEGIAVAAEAVKKLVEQRRSGDQIVEAQRGAPQGAAA